MLCSPFVDVQGCQDSKLQAERIAALQERKQALEALLNTRVGELKQVCLQEAVSGSQFPFKTEPNILTPYSPQVFRWPLQFIERYCCILQTIAYCSVNLNLGA